MHRFRCQGQTVFVPESHYERTRTSSQEERMKFDKWTLALAAGGVVSLGSIALAEEKPMSQVLTAVSSTTLSGYVDTSAIWKFGTGNANLPGRAFDGNNPAAGGN